MKDEKEEYLFDLLHPEEVYNKEKKKSWMVVREPYGKDNQFLKEYQDALLSNYQKNRVKFRLTSEEEVLNHQDLKASTDYIQNFNENYGHILK